MFADGLGVPITVAEVGETGALGAAMAAAIGVGLLTSYEAERCPRWRGPRASYQPDPAMRAHYDRRYRL